MILLTDIDDGIVVMKPGREVLQLSSNDIRLGLVGIRNNKVVFLKPGFIELVRCEEIHKCMRKLTEMLNHAPL